ncbi:hypothetical protein FIV06_23810 [Labrenzia sp. THAF191b]|uniref:hypothetical protein n=1 Tax=unclassified Labrenzia TaxID=2648686 RepID=UPI0012688D51|nr:MULTISPECIES: hypothetical protein [unclassified Labrenzia]QFT00475.1 hypothetical protein FIV06_23810 [Labrenzia sp. THAF191b]QFT06788.1 hypothetical protein FIV05_23805 [Labrenzia sp. THAF191a]QFT18332.1 hypothetical protein FIV03_23820 [Labrenzia sp. THAF187b]
MIKPPTDGQKILMHLAKQALKSGFENAWISRQDLLRGDIIPQTVGAKLLCAALTLPDGVLEWSKDQSAFRVSAASVRALNGEKHPRRSMSGVPMIANT